MTRALVATVFLLVPGVVAAQTPSLTVHDAVGAALRTHPRLGTAVARRAGAEAALAAAGSERLPSAAAGATLTRFQQPMIVAPLHAFDPSAPPTFHPTLVQTRFELGYVVFDGGGRGARRTGAAAEVRSADATLSDARMAVIEETATAYLRVLAAVRVDDAHRRRATALQAERERVERLLDAGRAARVDLLRAEAALAQAEADRATSRIEVVAAHRTLARLTSLPLTDVSGRLVTTTLRAPDSTEWTSAAAVAAALRDSPAVEAARQRSAAARAAVRAARAAWYPTVRLVGGVVTFGSGNGNLSAEWQGGFAVTYPLYTGGARSGRIAGAGARASAADDQVRLVQLEVESDADRSFTAVERAAARVTALRTAVDHLTEVARIEQLALDAGVGVQTDYLHAEADLVTARAALVEAEYAEIGARITLARATGALDEAWLARHLETVP